MNLDPPPKHNIRANDSPDETFAAALARIKSQSLHRAPAVKPPQWRPAILQALLDEIIFPRQDHLGEPRGGDFRWEIKQAEKLMNPLRCGVASVVNTISMHGLVPPKAPSARFKARFIGTFSAPEEITDV
jgi:hypothetical protein